VFVIEPSDTGNAEMAIHTEGCGIALLYKSPPSVRCLVGLLVGLADVAWNWPFTVPRRFPLEIRSVL
jgi:hypothetical protein